MVKLKILFSITSLLVINSLFSQEARTEFQLSEVQVGLFGGYYFKEYALNPSLSNRFEVGLDYSGSGSNTFLVPSFAINPRWYYNIKKRKRKGKNTASNSANYLSLFLRYHPDWFVISNVNDVSVVPDLSLIPMWGFRRPIGNSFSFEFGLGYGVRYTFFERSTEREGDLNLTVRFGYVF